MNERSRHVLDVLRSDEKLDWVPEELVASFSEGIAHSAKDEIDLAQRGFVMNLTQRERTKREKYEMSRPYEEGEKLDLIRFALQEVFITLPTMQFAASKALSDLGSKASAIEFSAPDEDERRHESYTRSLLESLVNIEDLKARIEAFHERLMQ